MHSTAAGAERRFQKIGRDRRFHWSMNPRKTGYDLLQEMVREARAHNDEETVQQCMELIRNMAAHFDHIQDVLLDYGLFGQAFGPNCFKS